MERPAETANTEKIFLATKAALRKTKNLKIKSIAFPALGAGVWGVNILRFNKNKFKSYKEHADEGTSINKILLVAYREEAYKEFRKAIEEEKEC